MKIDYPNYLFYVSAEEVETFRQHQQFKQQNEMLEACDGLQLTEVNGELKAVVDIDVYQYLVSFFMKNTQSSKDRE